MSRRVLVPQLAAPLRPPQGAVRTLHGETMGTSWTVKFVAPPGTSPYILQCGIQAELDSIVAQMSNWEADSHLSRFNRAAGGWHSLPAEFFHVLDCALAVASTSSGAFDPTAGPLVDLWGFGPAGKRFMPPDSAAVDAARLRCGWQQLKLDREGRRVWQPGGVALDLCGIAKGFGVDRVSAFLLRQGIDSHLVEVGGELRGEGVKPDATPWWVGVEAPTEDQSLSPPIIALHGLSVATSGRARRFVDVGGKRFAHTIDPRTGYPAENALFSVTVVHPSCTLADAWATAFMVLGPELGMVLAKERDIAALFVKEGQSGFIEGMSPALSALAR